MRCVNRYCSVALWITIIVKPRSLKKNKTYYVIDSSIGKVEIYSSKHIKINGERFNSINQARESLARYL